MSTFFTSLARTQLACAAALACLCLNAPAWAQAEITAASDGASVRADEPVTLNFVNADIVAVARTMASITGRNVVVDPRVKGQMNLVTDSPVLPAVAFGQFLSALRLYGFTVVESQGLYKVLPEADARLQAADVHAGSVPQQPGNQIVTRIFKLNHENASNLVPVLRPLISPNNTINTSPGSNALVITDYADNLQRIARIIAAMDVATATDVEVIPLRHAVASELVPLVQKLIESGGGAAAGVAAAQGAPAAAAGQTRTMLLPETRSNAIIVRAPNQAQLNMVRTLVEKLDQQALPGASPAGNIHVVYLKNADATQLAVTLRAALAADQAAASAALSAAAGSMPVNAVADTAAQTMATATSTATEAASGSSAATSSLTVVTPSTGGQIQADPATNSLIITAPEPQFRQLLSVIEKLDGRRAQVLVEALIIEVNTVKLAEFGVQWQTALGSSGDGVVGGIGNNSSVNGANIVDIALGIASGDYSSITLPANGLNVALAPRFNGKYYLGMLANFLENAGDGNVLSAPNLMTLDNAEARIVIGQNVPFVTGSYASSTGSNTVNPFTTVERQDVGLTLRVRPQINENGSVKMTVYQEVSKVDATTRNDPNGLTTSKRSIESTVLVDDGSIVVLGGLMEDSYAVSQDKVPVMGDIPVVGALFRNENRQRSKTNLLVFLRPVVIRNSTQADELSASRYDAIRALQQQTQPDTGNPMLGAVDSAPVLPALEDIAPAAARNNRARLIPASEVEASQQRSGRTSSLKDARTPEEQSLPESYFR